MLTVDVAGFLAFRAQGVGEEARYIAWRGSNKLDELLSAWLYDTVLPPLVP